MVVGKQKATKNQHYLPKSYLQFFSHQEKHKKFIYTYFCNQKLAKYIPIEDVCHDGSDTYANRWVRVDYAGNYDVDKTFTRDAYRDEWRYRDPVYTYYFYRDVAKESTSNPTGWTDVSNVVEYVQYRAK